MAGRLARSLVLVALVAGVPAPALAQLDAGPLVNWADMATWTEYNNVTRQTVMGIGLIPAGIGGTMRVSFEATLPGRRPTQPATSVSMRLIPPPLLTPNTMRSSIALFEVNAGREDRVVIDASDRIRTLEPQVGAYSTSASVAFTLDELQKLANASSIKANLLGIAVEFTPAQIKALKEYTATILKPKT